MMKNILLILILSGFACPLRSQTSFIKTYGDSLTDQGGYSIKQCYDGGYIVSGKNEGTHPTNFYVLKLNAFGDAIWTRTIGGDWMIGFDVIETVDSNYVISGYYTTSGALKCIKLDYNGNIV